MANIKGQAQLVAMPGSKTADAVFKRLCEDIEWLQAESEKETANGKASRARILFYALAGFLDERGIVEHLAAAARYIEEGIAQ